MAHLHVGNTEYPQKGHVRQCWTPTKMGVKGEGFLKPIGWVSSRQLAFSFQPVALTSSTVHCVADACEVIASRNAANNRIDAPSHLSADASSR